MYICIVMSSPFLCVFGDDRVTREQVMFQVMLVRHRAGEGLAWESFLWKLLSFYFQIFCKPYFYWNMNYYGLLEHCGLIG